MPMGLGKIFPPESATEMCVHDSEDKLQRNQVDHLERQS